VDSERQVLDYIEGFGRFRPGTEKFLSECADSRIQFTVVSAGLDFCIRQAFHASRLELPRLVCPKSSLNASRGFLLSFPRHRIATSKDFKEDLLIRLKRQGHKVIFIGDGAGDFNAAVLADALFTITGSPLDLICADRRIPHESVRTLVPIWKFVHRVRAQKPT